MTKIDFKKTLKDLYKPTNKEFSIVTVPAMNFLMVDGKGDPNSSQEFKDALEALFPLAFKVKFLCKEKLGFDYVVPPLEGLWWVDDMKTFKSCSKDEWKWTAMIMTPDNVPESLVEEAVARVRKKKHPVALEKIRYEHYAEGPSVQILHLGSFDDEAPTIARLHDVYLPENGLVENGKHHEIYLSDFRKTSPERLRTILRQPVRKGE